jgi:hypothetical protein
LSAGVQEDDELTSHPAKAGKRRPARPGREPARAEERRGRGSQGAADHDRIWLCPLPCAAAAVGSRGCYLATACSRHFLFRKKTLQSAASCGLSQSTTLRRPAAYETETEAGLWQASNPIILQSSRPIYTLRICNLKGPEVRHVSSHGRSCGVAARRLQSPARLVTHRPPAAYSTR